MGKQDPLFLLIKSLGAGEKAAVRNTDKGQSAYIALFDLIARQREYDERKVRKKLQQQGIDDERVLDVMRRVPRHIFVDEALADLG